MEQSPSPHNMTVAIYHPKSQTFRTLSTRLPTLDEKGLRLPPLSKIVRRKNL